MLDIEVGTIHYRDSPDKSRTLTKKLLQFVTVLYEQNGEVLDKKVIVERVWDGKTSSENVTQTVNKLRGIFEDHKKVLIVNHPGKGYSLNFRVIEDNTISKQRLPSIEKRMISWLNIDIKYANKLRVFTAIVLTLIFSSLSINNIANTDASDSFYKLELSDASFTQRCQIDAVNKVLLCE
ncbi:hypothetical protein M445_05580 [Vibrio owensii 47666-1]|uniref:winged helix-turn-helix domain-containing protein n=1 Tax=Vibrio owensii TaxID=696485 RepID=UPI000585B5CD|nr:winged helix-turn-helix domain-containing protein [Vibrio owensii]KIF48811.1 hypothetical protein M445_05580 [Vibrio owensii 47666-1]